MTDLQNRYWTVYTLKDPRGGGVRYVGVTFQALKNRLTAHLSKARNSPKKFHLYNWIRKLDKEGITPLMEVLEFGVGKDWGFAEKKWIRWYREQGAELTNATDGGEGVPGHAVSEEAREKIRLAHLGKPLSEEHREKLSKIRKGRKNSPQAVAKTAAYWRGRKHRPETKVKISEARAGKPGWKPTPEQIANRVAKTRERMTSPDWIDPRIGRHQSEECKLKISAARKGYRHSPETKKKISEARKRAVHAE